MITHKLTNLAFKYIFAPMVPFLFFGLFQTMHFLKEEVVGLEERERYNEKTTEAILIELKATEKDLKASLLAIEINPMQKGLPYK